MELLAPAGNAEALRAAVNAGADAVYLAGNSFGARAFADNFSNDELASAVRFAHLHGVAVHVTVNTVVNDAEFAELDEYLKFLGSIDVDAILVQDLGVASRARELIPHIPIHASTQMTIHNIEGVRAAAEMGFSRVVLARELSIAEIGSIVAASDIEIEVFMHGALCVCTSGQCLMSSMIGARSGNRGRCAQPCRLPYELIADDGEKIDAGKYILSPKDLNSIERLPELIASGVSSLKIEGRMKRAEYVAIVVETYRRAIDRCLQSAEDYSATIEERRRLAQIFNRDFTTAYLDGKIDRNMISDKKPNNRGLPVGRISAIEGRRLTIKASEAINVGDRLEIWIKVGGRINFEVSAIERRGSDVVLTVESTKGVRGHDRVFKIFDAELAAHAREFFEEKSSVGKIAIDARVEARLDQPLELTIDDREGNVIRVRTAASAIRAERRPLTRETIEKQLSRLGTTEFVLAGLSVDLDDGLIIPISELNDVRRRAIEQLEAIRLKSFGRRSRQSIDTSEVCNEINQRNSAEHQSSENAEACNEVNLQNSAVHQSIATAEACNAVNMHDFTERQSIEIAEVNVFPSFSLHQLLVSIDTIDKLGFIGGSDGVIFGGDSFRHQTLTPDDYLRAIDFARSIGKRIYIATPRLVRNAELPLVEEIIRAASAADGIYVHNIGTLRLARRISTLPIFTDFSLIAFNSTTLETLARMGVSGATLSPELTLEQVNSLAKKSPLPLECIIAGRAELMIMFYCPIGSFAGCNRVCERKRFALRDRMNAEFPIVTDQFCRAHILNSRVLSMADHIGEFGSIERLRIDGRAMSTAELTSAIKKCRAALDGEAVVEDGADFTRGHYFRGV